MLQIQYQWHAGVKLDCESDRQMARLKRPFLAVPPEALAQFPRKYSVNTPRDGSDTQVWYLQRFCGYTLFNKNHDFT